MRFAKVTLTSLATGVRALLGQLRGLGQDGDDAGAEPYDDAELLNPIGLVARPTRGATLQALLVEVGEELLGLLVRDKGKPVWSDVEEGETRVYSANNAACRVRLRNDGSIDIEAGPGADIRLNGGSLKLARVSDPVLVGNLTVGGVGGVVLTFTPVDASGAPGLPIGPSATVQLSAVIPNATGAPHAKG